MNYRIPQYLHRPIQLLWWEQDQIVAIIVGYLLGFFLGGWWYLGLVAVPWAYFRLRRRLPRGALIHAQYAAGLLTLPGYPTYFERRFEE